MIIKLTNLDGSSKDFEFEDDGKDSNYYKLLIILQTTNNTQNICIASLEVTANGIKDFFKGRGNGDLFRLGDNGRRIGVLKDQLNLQYQYEYVLNNPIDGKLLKIYYTYFYLKIFTA